MVQKLALEYTTYPDKIGSGLYHFKANGPLKSEGFGSDFNETKALIKAATECAERHCLYSVKGQASTSSGFAGHSDPEQARRRAYFELLERDAFLLGWLSGRSPEWLTSEQVNSFADSSALLAKIEAQNFQVRIGKVASTADGVTVVGVLQPGKFCELQFGVVFGCACHNSLAGATMSVAVELARATTVLLNRRKRAEKVYAEIDVSEVRDGRSTFEYYLNPKNIKPITPYLQNSQQALDLPALKVNFQTFDRQIAGPDLSLAVVWAKSDLAQQLFFGHPTQQSLNDKRFESLGLAPSNFAVMPLP